MKKPTNKAERDALIKELQAMTFNELPKRWGEWEELYRPELPKEIQEQLDKFGILLQLRDVYREGWVPDWGDMDLKYCVTLKENNPFVMIRQHHNTPFSFQTQERAELFLENFGDYLEKVKPLFS